MSDKLSIIKAYLEKHVGQPYIWGGAERKLTPDTYISIINNKETSGGYSDGTSFKAAAIAFCRRLFDDGEIVLYGFDCSGYISKALMAAGLRSKRGDCDSLWSNCTRIERSQLQDGDLLFCVKDSNAEDETHVGMYVEGYQYHAKGRKYGVTRERFDAGDWDKFGRYPGITSTSAQSEASPDAGSGDYVFTRILKYGRRGPDVVELKKALQAKGYGAQLTTDTSKNAAQNYYGATRSVVKEFQRSAGVDPDGIAGPATFSKLGCAYEL